jgi:protein-S-isoprenylcysteine O-methyltransferase Ste14
MPTEDAFLARAVVAGSALVYWAGVLVQARRIRRHIGRSPNVRPRGPKEILLWAGWLVVVAAWLALPFLAGSRAPSAWLRLIPSLLHPLGLGLGILMTVAGYAGTLWCYAAMGDTWRMGIDRNEKTILVSRGPYRFVRHPIYLYQVVMLAGVALQLPTLLSLVVLVVHFLCVLLKASDEESYLLTVHGQEYRDYRSMTGRLFPKWPSRSGSLGSAHPDDGKTR